MDIQIPSINKDIAKQLQHKIDFKTKPLGALGMLEKIALKVGCIQQSLSPTLNAPHLIVFAGDHGLAKEGVSAYPQEVTHQMVLNFLGGGAAINVFCKQHAIQLKVVDAGVNHDFGDLPNLIHAKMGKGTNSCLSGVALTPEQVNNAIQKGQQIVKEEVHPDCQWISFGEMGIGNTSSAALIMHYLTQLPIETCVGRGTGVNDEQLTRKLDILNQVIQHHGNITDPYEILSAVGGFEIAQMVGAYLQAAQQKTLICVDGFIATAAYAIAQQIAPSLADYVLFAHQSNEKGHAQFIEQLGGESILNLGLRLGEGTGSAIAYPIVSSAVHFINEMSSFEDAGVSNKE